MEELDWIFDNDALETHKSPALKSITLSPKRHIKRANLDAALASIALMPMPNESIHLITNGIFDFFTLADFLIAKLDKKVERLYASTWTMNQQTIRDIFEYFDTGIIGEIAILSDRSFKRRKPAEYAMLIEGLRDRGQRFIAFNNHAKIVLLNNHEHYLTIECSASFTINPRLEQHVITNDKALWQFHRDWMQEMFESSG